MLWTRRDCNIDEHTFIGIYIYIQYQNKYIHERQLDVHTYIYIHVDITRLPVTRAEAET